MLSFLHLGTCLSWTLILIGLGPPATGFHNGAFDREIEQPLEQLKRMAHHPPGVVAIGRETLPRPAMQAIPHDVEGRCTRLASRIGRMVIMEGTPPQIALPSLFHLTV